MANVQAVMYNQVRVQPIDHIHVNVQPVMYNQEYNILRVLEEIGSELISPITGSVQRILRVNTGGLQYSTMTRSHTTNDSPLEAMWRKLNTVN